MNHLWVVLDSVSYKVFTQSASPNLHGLGPVEMVGAHGSWTLPAIMGLLYIPFLAGKSLAVEKYHYHKWFPGIMQGKGYQTTLISDNPWFEVGQSHISKGFDNYVVLPRLGCSEEIIQAASEHISGKFFTVLWFTATHKPFFYPDKGKASDLTHRLRSIEYVDGLLGGLFEKLPPDTHIVATSDHGNAWLGETCLGHNPKDIHVYQDTHYQVFYIEGKV